ncbi:MAG: hypothetical protein WC750_03195 [Patescibacteria group bacterium]
MSPRFRYVLQIAERADEHDVTLSEVTQCTMLEHEAEASLAAIKQAAEKVRQKFDRQPSRCPSTPPPPSTPPEAVSASPSSPAPSERPRPEGFFRRRLRLGHT